jgi:hypothetical protein
MDYVGANHRFADFVVHEAAYILRNRKRRTLGLPGTRRRELEIDQHAPRAPGVTDRRINR